MTAPDPSVGRQTRELAMGHTVALFAGNPPTDAAGVELVTATATAIHAFIAGDEQQSTPPAGEPPAEA